MSAKQAYLTSYALYSTLTIRSYTEKNTEQSGVNNEELSKVETDKNTVGMIGKDGVFYLRNEAEIQRVHSYFYDFTFNRINFVNNESKQKKVKLDTIEEQKSEETKLFKPKIDELSKMIEQSKKKSHSRTPRFDLLLSKGKEYNDKKSVKAIQSKEKEVEGCTFIPVLYKPQSSSKRNNNITGSEGISIEESKCLLKESLVTSNTSAHLNRSGVKSKKLKPKINHVIMELNSK